VIAALPGPDLEARGQTAAREATLLKPKGALGRLEALTLWLSAWQGSSPPKLRRPRIAVFAGNHGVALRGVSAYPQRVTAEMVKAFLAGQAAINQLATSIDADLRVYELDLDHPTADIAQAAAMSEADCARAIAYGMMALEPGIDVLCLGEMGIGNTTVAAALAAGLFGGTAADWVGPGTGVGGATLARKREAVEAALARHGPAVAGKPFEALRRLGGLEFAAIFGATIAARRARVPVLLDGYAATAAAAVLFKIAPGLIDHCEVGHCSAEPGHARLLKLLGKRPLLDLGLRLGEGTGAALAVSILKAAVACHTGMASFSEAQVAGPV
jgi:nicotinate-nucleotide--dimethylbenzimidazole phosphoribosyltransferase